jgi:hypothetical protein
MKVYYKVYSYYDGNYRGLEDSFITTDRSEMQDWVHNKVSQGNCVKILKTDIGGIIERRITPDEYFDGFEGEFPYSDI